MPKPNPSQQATRDPADWNPMIGSIVWWFPKAEFQVGPRPAVVTGPPYASPEGILHLRAWGQNVANGDVIRNVRHVRDPKLETHPRMRESGAWMEMPPAPSPPFRSARPKAATKSNSTQ